MTPLLSVQLDRAVRSSSEDRLNTDAFVKALVPALTRAPKEGSLVIGLYGPWGRGKSSALNLLEQSLNSIGREGGPQTAVDVRARVIRFTPWYYTGVEGLLKAFFATLAEGVAGDTSMDEEQRKKWSVSLRSMGNIIAPTARLATALLAPKAVADLVDKGVELVQATFESGADLVAEGEDSFRKRQAEAAAVLAQLANGSPPTRVVVMIDELDRVGAEEILAVLKMVKLVADLPNVTYVLAMDAERVGEILDAHMAEVGGAKFLEKIIQLGIELPPTDPTFLMEILLEEVKSIAGSARLNTDDFDVDLARDAFLRDPSTIDLVTPWLETMRDTARLSNAYRFALTAAGDDPHLHAEDILLLTTLQTFAPAVYRQIPRNRAFLLADDMTMSRLVLSGTNNDEEAVSAERRRRLSAVAKAESSEDRYPDMEKLRDRVALDPHAVSKEGVILEILTTLFPRAISGDAPSENDAVNERSAGRIRSADRFGNYFRLVPLPTQATRSEIRRISRAIFSTDGADLPSVLLELGEMELPKRLDLLGACRDHLRGLDANQKLTISSSLHERIEGGGDLLLPLMLTVADDLLRHLFLGYASPDDYPERHEAGVRMVEATASRLPSPVGAQFVQHLLSSEVGKSVKNHPDLVLRLARAGLECCKKALEGISNPFNGRPEKEAVDLLRSARRFEAHIAQVDTSESSVWLNEYLGGVLVHHPEATSQVIALALPRNATAPHDPILDRDGTSESLVNSIEKYVSRETVLDAVERVTADGLLSKQKWPGVVELFIAERDDAAKRILR